MIRRALSVRRRDAGRPPLLLAAAAALLAPLALGACGAGEVELPAPSPVIVHSGERLHADPDTMREVHRWLTRALEVIEEDPSFWIISEPATRTAYPWEAVHVVTPDSVRVEFERTHPDAQTANMIYAFLHILDRQGRLDEFLPQAPYEDEFEKERAILQRVSDTWLLGRAVFATNPYQPLDELMYATEEGWLEAFILTARPEEFAEARAAWESQNPGRQQEYVSWFRETFGIEPPGLRETPGR